MADLIVTIDGRTDLDICLRALRDRLIAGVLERIPDAYLTGHPEHRVPNNASFVFPGVEGESILLHLDLAGVAASSGSAGFGANPTAPTDMLCALADSVALEVTTATAMSFISRKRRTMSGESLSGST